MGGCCLGDATFGGAPWLVKYLGVQLGGAPSDTGAAPPSHPLTLGGAPPFAPPLHPLQTGAAPPGFGGAPPLHPPAPSKVLDFGILPMYLSFQVHLWSSVLWMLEEYYSFSFSPFQNSLVSLLSFDGCITVNNGFHYWLSFKSKFHLFILVTWMAPITYPTVKGNIKVPKQYGLNLLDIHDSFK